MSSFPACQVCQKKFSLKGPAPFLLPCLHSVCETCVTSAVGGVISCSPCQRDVNLTETTLQKDVIREKEILHLTVQHNPELVLCTHEDDGNQAVCWCKECEGFLCEHCQNVHGSFKGTKQHTVYDVGELELGNLIEDRYCRVHPKFIADTWDTNCCMLTCRKCRLSDHSDHEAVDVEEASKASRRKFETFQEEVESFVDQHKAHSTEATEDLQKSAKSSSILPENISHTFNSMKTLIDQREVELRITHQQWQDRMERQLNEKRESADICQQRCRTTSDYINKTLKYSSMHDIVELRTLLEEKTKDCRSSAPSEDYKSLPLPVFNIDGLARIKSTLGKFGAITMDDAVPENHTEERETRTNDDPNEYVKLLKQELEEAKVSKTMAVLEKTRVKKGFIQWMSKVDKRAIMWMVMVAIAIILTTLVEMKRLQKEFDSLRMNVLDKSYILNRPDVEFSRTRYNTEEVHINDDGELINTPQPNPPHSDQRLKNFYGTSSTAPLSQSEYPQYWEVKTHVDIIESMTGGALLLEIGLIIERERDQQHCINGLNSYSLTVSHYNEDSSISGSVWRHGNRLVSLPDTVEIKPGTSFTLHYGVVYDSVRQRIAFLHLKDEVIIGKTDDVDSSIALWPMFGVYNSHLVTISMSLVVGNDIDMSESKRNLIMKSLS